MAIMFFPQMLVAKIFSAIDVSLSTYSAVLFDPALYDLFLVLASGQYRRGVGRV